MDRRTVERNSILIGLVGSHAYGLATENSDRDYKGICIAPLEYQLGIKTFEQKDKGWDTEDGDLDYLSVRDVSIYDIKKYFKMVVNNNPNSLELLYLGDYKVLTKIGRELVRQRHLFLSKKLKHSFAGYGWTQINKIEKHRKWLLNPPKKKPQLADHGLEDLEPLSKSELNGFLEFLWLLVRDRIEYLEPIEELHRILLEKFDFKAILKTTYYTDRLAECAQSLTRSTSDFISLLHKTQTYRSSMKEWEDYQSWKKHRNPARAALERKCGYDAKFASQALRLLIQGLRALRTGELIVDLRETGEAEEILDIKLGNVPYEVVQEQSHSLFAELDSAYESSPLPNSPNKEEANNLCLHLIQKHWNF